MKLNPDEITAYHEAGHAVMALLLDRPVHRVSIEPNNQRLGACEFRKGVFRPSEDWLEQEMLISLGGVAAELILTGDFGRVEASADLLVLRKLAVGRAGDRRVEKLERRMLSKAQANLADQAAWQAIEWIAQALLHARTISGRAARHFFERACREHDS